MRSKPFLRYFARPELEVSFAYFKAFRDAGYSIRVLAQGVIDLGIPPWQPYAADFATALPSDFVNVVVGHERDLRNFYTVGVRNVAILASIDAIPDALLGQYSLVLCHEQADAAKLADSGITALWALPFPDILADLF